MVATTNKWIWRHNSKIELGCTLRAEVREGSNEEVSVARRASLRRKGVLKDGRRPGEMLCGVLEPHVPEFKSWPHHLLAV